MRKELFHMERDVLNIGDSVDPDIEGQASDFRITIQLFRRWLCPKIIRMRSA